MSRCLMLIAIALLCYGTIRRCGQHDPPPEWQFQNPECWSDLAARRWLQKEGE